MKESIMMKNSQREIDEESCKRILYHRVAYACPGVRYSDIQRYELNDGTVIFGVDNNGTFATYNIDWNFGLISLGSSWIDPTVKILVRAPWAFIAYREGKIIDNDVCKRALVETLILEKFLSQ